MCVTVLAKDNSNRLETCGGWIQQCGSTKNVSILHCVGGMVWIEAILRMKPQSCLVWLLDNIVMTLIIFTMIILSIETIRSKLHYNDKNRFRTSLFKRELHERPYTSVSLLWTTKWRDSTSRAGTCLVLHQNTTPPFVGRYRITPSQVKRLRFTRGRQRHTAHFRPTWWCVKVRIVGLPLSTDRPIGFCL